MGSAVWVPALRFASAGTTAEQATAAEQAAAASSRHRKAQRLAAARHVDGGETGGGKAAACAVALLIGLELALAGTKLFAPAPVQRLVLHLDGAVVGIDRLGKTKDLLRLAGDV